MSLTARWSATVHGHPCAADLHLAPGVYRVEGPNGSGKSTLLRALAGLHGSLGSMAWGGQPYDGPAGTTPPSQRALGMLFQQSLLLPHLTVEQNLRFPGKAPLDDALVHAFHLSPLLSRRPHALSGGEARRVAWALALRGAPPLLLLDEPFVGLDAATRTIALTLLHRHGEQAVVLVATHLGLPEGRPVVRQVDHTWRLDGGGGST